MSERPICPTHGPRALAIDMREGSRGWVCCAASPPQLLPCMPVRLPVSATPEPGPQSAAPPTEAATHLPHAIMPWFQQGPPLPSTPRPPTHSWIFVPLLHAAARRLTTSAERAWEADARFAGVWQRYVVLLRNAPPVPPEVLLRTLDALQQLATASGHPCPPAEAALLQSLAHETSCLPASTLAHFPWAWQLFTLAGG